MTGLDRDTSKSPDRTGVCCTGRCAPSQCETITGPSFSSLNKPDQERTPAYRDSSGSESPSGCLLCYFFRRLGGAIWGIPVKGSPKPAKTRISRPASRLSGSRPCTIFRRWWWTGSNPRRRARARSSTAAPIPRDKHGLRPLTGSRPIVRLGLFVGQSAQSALCLLSDVLGWATNGPLVAKSGPSPDYSRHGVKEVVSVD